MYAWSFPQLSEWQLNVCLCRSLCSSWSQLWCHPDHSSMSQGDSCMYVWPFLYVRLRVPLQRTPMSESRLGSVTSARHKLQLKYRAVNVTEPISNSEDVRHTLLINLIITYSKTIQMTIWNYCLFVMLRSTPFWSIHTTYSACLSACVVGWGRVCKSLLQTCYFQSFGLKVLWTKCTSETINNPYSEWHTA